MGRSSEFNGLVAVHLVREVPEFNLRENDVIVARDNDLKVILPNSKTREEAETLPLFTSGS